MIEMFGSFLPMAVMVLRGMPFLGPLLSAPGVATVIDKLAGANTKRYSV
jgi:hypothetical protein